MKNLKHLLVCAALLWAASASAQTVIEGSNLTWELSDSTLTISGTGAMPDLPMPGTTPWNSGGIKTVKIENGVTSIGAYAFLSCMKLTSIELAPSVKSIGNGAFVANFALTQIDLASVEKIGAQAFGACQNIKSLVIPNSVISIDSAAFWGCLIDEVTIPAL